MVILPPLVFPGGIFVECVLIFVLTPCACICLNVIHLSVIMINVMAPSFNTEVQLQRVSPMTNIIKIRHVIS
jgi:hypothetical protein